MVPPNFYEDDSTWVASKLSGAAGGLGAEAIKIKHLLLRFGCALEDLRGKVVDILDRLVKLSPPRAD